MFSLFKKYGMRFALIIVRKETTYVSRQNFIRGSDSISIKKELGFSVSEKFTDFKQHYQYEYAWL